MEREINVGEAALLGGCDCVACNTHWAWPTTGPFEHSGLGLEDMDPWRGSLRPVPDGWKQQSGMEKFCENQSSDVLTEKQHE